jgi:hypothetical protein
MGLKGSKAPKRWKWAQPCSPHLAALLLSPSLISGLLAALAPTPAVASGTTAAFNFTGGGQTWTVPSGVTSVQVDARGAAGGIGPLSGFGGRLVADVAVTPGQVLQVQVGGLGGYNGGAPGGRTSQPYPNNGGGASDVRTGTDLSTRIVVAGGGAAAGAEVTLFSERVDQGADLLQLEVPTGPALDRLDRPAPPLLEATVGRAVPTGHQESWVRAGAEGQMAPAAAPAEEAVAVAITVAGAGLAARTALMAEAVVVQAGLSLPGHRSSTSRDGTSPTERCSSPTHRRVPVPRPLLRDP